MPPPSATTAPPAPERPFRSRCLSSAERLFDRSGFSTVSFSQVARDADLPVATLQDEFPTKHALVVAVLEARHRSWTRNLDDMVTPHADPRDRLLAVFSYLESTFREPTYRGCAFINGYGEAGRRNAEVARLAHEHLAWFEQYVADLCVTAGLPGPLANAMSLLAQGAQVEAAIHGTVRPASSARTTAAMLIAVYSADAA